MLEMNFANQSPPADVCLLLRAHAEARWLSREVVPVIRELEHDFSSGAALAYLEALRIEAHHHAVDTDAARGEVDALAPAGDHGVLANAGVELLALTDHDTVSGVSEALAAGERAGLRVVPAVEISAIDRGPSGDRELHILGYRIDHTRSALGAQLANFLADRERRTLR